MRNQVVLWYGYPIRLDKYVWKLNGNEYWYATTLYTKEPEVMMVSINPRSTPTKFA